MKIYAKEKHSPYNIIKKFDNKKELLEYAQERKNNVTGSIIDWLEQFEPTNKKTISELLDFCNLEIIENKKEPIIKKLYINIDDKQNGEWALGFCGTLKQWRDAAMAWAFQDDMYSTYNMLKYYKVKNHRLIEFINDIWDIEIIEFNQNTNYLNEYGLEIIKL